MQSSIGQALNDLPPLVYNALPTLSTIRILHLFPGEGDEPIRCQLRIVDLDSTTSPVPAYIGVSYCWGDTNDLVAIICNDQRATITRTLHSALMRIRAIMSPSTLWIDALAINLWADALCINQSREPTALREREQQVKLMSRIYSEAQEVIVDLGDRPKYFDDLLAVFDRFYRVPDHLWVIVGGQMKPIDELSDLVPSHHFYHHFYSFLYRPWFQRVWVVQEVVLAQTVSMMIGIQIFDPEYLSKVLERAVIYPAVIASSLNGRSIAALDFRATNSAIGFQSKFDEMFQMQRERKTAPTIRHPFRTILKLGFELKATDARDRLYGLYGLADHELTDVIPVNYSTSVHILSSHVSRLLIGSGRAAYAMSLAAGPGKGRPSWSIDLERSRGHGGSSDMLLGDTVEENGWCDLYQACGSTLVDIRFAQDDQFLVVSGVIVDLVTATTDEYPFLIYGPVEGVYEKPRTSERNARTIRDSQSLTLWHNKNFSWFSESFKGLSPNEMRNLYWTTCTGDRTVTGRLADEVSLTLQELLKRFNFIGSGSVTSTTLVIWEIKPGSQNNLPFTWIRKCPESCRAVESCVWIRGCVKQCTIEQDSSLKRLLQETKSVSSSVYPSLSSYAQQVPVIS